MKRWVQAESTCRIGYSGVLASIRDQADTAALIDSTNPSQSLKGVTWGGGFGGENRGVGRGIGDESESARRRQGSRNRIFFVLLTISMLLLVVVLRMSDDSDEGGEEPGPMHPKREYIHM